MPRDLRKTPFWAGGVQHNPLPVHDVVGSGRGKPRPSPIPAVARIPASAVPLQVADEDDPLEAEARNLADQVIGPHGPPLAGPLLARPSYDLAALPVNLNFASSGHPLAGSVRHRIEAALNVRLSGVRIHADDSSAESAGSLGALAYSLGGHVVLGRNDYSASEPRRSWLVAHELAHVVQHAEGRGTRVLHRQVDEVPELDRQFAAAVENGDWKRAAWVLNRFNAEDINRRLANRNRAAGPVLSRGQIASLYVGALENETVGKDSATANHTRAVYLDLNYENELRHGHWARAAEFLNGFNEHDIIERLQRFSSDLDRLQALHDGAVESVGSASAAAIYTERRINAVRLERRIEAPRASGELNLPEGRSAGLGPRQPGEPPRFKPQ